jgi:chain length determinant protein EpsF
MRLQQYYWILRARWKTAARTFAAVLATVVILSLVIPKHYKAEASVVADLKNAGPLDDNAWPSALVERYSGTQVDIIQSDRVARDVVDRLHLSKMPEIVAEWRASRYYEPDNFVPWAARWLQKHLAVQSSRESNVISIRFSSTDAQFAAAAANAFSAAYLQAALDLNVDSAKNFAQWFNDQTRSLRTNLEAAQSRLSAFQLEHGIVATDDRVDVETLRLNNLETQLASAQAQHVDSSSRQKQTGVAADQSPEVLQNSLINSLKSDIAHTEAQLQQVEARLGVNHPEYLSLQAQLLALKAREDTEVRRVMGSLGTINRVSVERESDMRAAVDAQKAKVLQLRAQHDQAAVLQRDVDTAQRAYELVTSRLGQVSLEGALQQINVSVLTPAVAPIKPTWPLLLLNTALGVVLAGIAGIGHALVRESSDLRIYNAAQLASIAPAPAFTLRLTNGAATVASTRRPLLALARAWLPQH